MNADRILAVVVSSVSGEFIECFHASTITGVIGGIWVAGKDHDYVSCCFLIEGFRSRSYTIPTGLYPESNSEMVRFVSDAEAEGWNPFNRIGRIQAGYEKALGERL